MCTYEHAFDGKGLMNVIYKVVESEPPELPATYSKQLNDLLKMFVHQTMTFSSMWFSRETIVSFVQCVPCFSSSLLFFGIELECLLKILNKEQVLPICYSRRSFKDIYK
jgi:hypothetical protein